MLHMEEGGRGGVEGRGRRMDHQRVWRPGWTPYLLGKKKAYYYTMRLKQRTIVLPGQNCGSTDQLGPRRAVGGQLKVRGLGEEEQCWGHSDVKL